MKPMSRLPFLTALVLFLLAATGVQAALYTVTLKNGTIFETRYEPIVADFDPDLMLLRTDRGNWIGLEKAEIEDIISKAEESGFGYQLDTTTLYLGWSPNDLVENATGEEGSVEKPRYEVDAAPTSEAYSINQFLSYGGTTPTATSFGGGAPVDGAAGGDGEN